MNTLQYDSIVSDVLPLSMISGWQIHPIHTCEYLDVF